MLIRVFLSILLFISLISGLLLAYPIHSLQQTILWIHLSSGFLFAAIILLFLLDHLSRHKNKLIQITQHKVLSGWFELIVLVLLLLSGFLLYLFGSIVNSPWTEIHFYSTLLLLLFTLYHRFTSK